MIEKTNIYLPDNDLKNLKLMIEYLLNSEKEHYEESAFSDFRLKDDNEIFNKEFYNKPEINHIYAITRRVQDAINSNL